MTAPRRSRSLVDAPSKEPRGVPPPRRAPRFHLVAGIVVVALSAGAWAVFASARETSPARGYTSLGTWLGILGSAAFLGIAGYAVRKRIGQEWRWLPGRLDTWLRVHAWASLLGLVFVLLHAGLHLDGRAGTVAVWLLVGTLVSGVAGLFAYRAVPARVAAGPRNLATGATADAIVDVDERIGLELTGRSEALRVRALRAAGPAGPRAVGVLPPGEAAVLERIEALRQERTRLVGRAATQSRLHRLLRGWLWVHVPLSILFLVGAGYHVVDATEAKFLLRAPRPDDFASPESCLPCHRTQYEEWIRSPHAVAQSSPVMDLQNRLVVLKDRALVAAGGAPIAGDVCVRCHAPTGYVGAKEHTEDLLAPIEARAPASRFGVSCVTCHQIDAMHGQAPDPNGLVFRNMENFTWKPGRTMFGSFGRSGEALSVGNSAHRGAYAPHLESPEMCASCHTVVVAHAAADSPTKTVTLQNTYTEWREGGAMNWATEGLACMDCHNRRLREVGEHLEALEKGRVPLALRLADVRRRLAKNELPSFDTVAAEPVDGFDLPLPRGRRRYLHTFAGVDERLGADVPYHAGHARHGENATIRKDALANTKALMRIAAGVRVVEWPKGDEVRVEVGNLGTGHNLPAGFAFARELWLEVAAGRSANGPFVVLTGGDGRGGAIEGATPLDKSQANLRNFQAVLFDSRTKQETVLQNEATTVLKGEPAVRAGFVDRENFLRPGEARVISIRLGDGGLPAGTTHLRVRLRFRSLAPEFLASAPTPSHSGGIAARFDALGEAPNAARARALLSDLVVLEVATDVLAK